MVDGHTYAEAVKNAEQIIDEWIATPRKLGRPIPEPRGKLALPLFAIAR
jgi:predicted RNase H-like HicB family nuclease